jgi:zinc protease
MRHLRLINSEFEKERQVVIEERRLRIEDNPNA